MVNMPEDEMAGEKCVRPAARALKIALVTDWFAPRLGGIEAQLLGLAHAMERTGVTAHVITSLPGPETVEGIRVTRLGCPLLPLAQVALPFGLRKRLVEALSAEDHDVVHVHPSIVAPVCLAGAQAARDLSLPLLATFHSSMVSLPHTLGAAERLFGWTAGNVTLSGVSRMIAAQLARIEPHHAPLVLPNGFDDGFWMTGRTPANLAAGEPLRVAVAMRLQATKRPVALVRAFAQARRIASGGNRDLHLTIAGDGSLASSVRRTVHSMGLDRHVTFAGWLDRDGLRDLYETSHVFMQASTKESFGIAGLEARASGLPVLARAGTGMADYLDHEADGFLAASDGELAQRLADLALQPDLLARLSGPRPALTRFGWDAVAARHLDLYRSLATRSGTSAQSEG